MVNKGRPFVARSRECLLDVTLCPGVPIMDGQERSVIRHSALNVDGGFTSALGTGVLLSCPRPRPTEGITRGIRNINRLIVKKETQDVRAARLARRSSLLTTLHSAYLSFF